MQEIYLDYNATAPLRTEARDALLPWMQGGVGNPSSIHLSGQKARQAIEGARSRMAELLGCSSEEIIFTSGGTESNNLAIKGAAKARSGALVVAATEHPSVLEVVRAIAGHGREIRWLPVDSAGNISLETLRASLEGAALVTVMAANNETGVLHPVEAVAKLCAAQAVPLLCDAVQGVGKIRFNLKESGIAYLSASGHKFGAPPGVGFLFVRKGMPLKASMLGGEQENSLRAGTENTPGVVAMAAALAAACADLETEQVRQASLRDRLQRELLKQIPGVQIYGGDTARVANTLMAGFPGVESDVMIMRLDQEGLRVSSGSACAAGAIKDSHVLEAMGIKNSRSRGLLRFSLGSATTEKDIDRTLQLTVQAWHDLGDVGEK